MRKNFQKVSMEQTGGDPCISLESLFFLSPKNPPFNLTEMIRKRGFHKIGRSIMDWRKYCALERREQPRYPTGVQVELNIWGEVAKKLLTSRVTGCLVNISVKGARLQTNTARIAYHHLTISGDPGGETPLILEFRLPSEGIPWKLKAQIFWYNKIGIDGEFKFEFGIGFVEISLTQKNYHESLIKLV